MVLVGGLNVFWFFFGSMIVCIFVLAHRIYVAKSWGGGWREEVRWARLLCENSFHSHCIFSVLMVAYRSFPFGHLSRPRCLVFV